jgi:iron complex outermembrane receptor protein
MKMLANYVGCLSVIALAVHAEAQIQTQTQSQTGIETLVVTGERASSSAVNAQRLDVTQLQPGSRADAAELLQGINGVQADSRSNYAQDTRITLRGFGARSAFGVRGLDLQIDGIPLTMPDGQGQFSGAVLDGVTHISVLTGPVAALYGNGAGGVINLQTSAPKINRLAAGTAADEDGLARHHLLGEFRDANLGVRVQASKLNADGNRPHASAEREQLGAQVYYTLDNGVQAQYRFDKEDAPLLQDPLGLTQAQWLADPYQTNSSAEFFNTRKSISHQQHAFSLRQTQGDKRWQFALWQGERDIQQYLAQRGDALANSGGVVDLSRQFSGGNGNYTWDFNVAKQDVSFTLGAEWSAMDDRRQGFVNNAGVAGDLRRNELGQADNRDAYALLQWQATPQWQWLLGARQSRIELSVDDYFVIANQNADDSGEKSFNRNSHSLSTRYQINAEFSVHAAIGNGFEAPTLTEMAYTNGDKGFNQRLDAATNRQQEISVDYQAKDLTLALTLFNIETRAELVVDQSINGRTTYINAAGTERKGIEFKGTYQLTENIDARIALNYLDATYSQGNFASLQLPGIAKNNHYAQLNWSPFGNELLTFGLSAVHRSSVAASDNNQITAPAYTTLDFSASGKIDIGVQTSWWIKLANLEDETYVGSVIVNQTNGRSFESASGRNLAAGVRFGYEF